MKKAVWMRLGVTVMLHEREITEIEKGGPVGKVLIQDLDVYKRQTCFWMKAAGRLDFQRS